MKVVLDTNIFISGIHWQGSPSKVLQAWAHNKFELVSSLEIIEEIVNTLMNFKKPMPPEDILWWKDLIFQKASIVIPTKKLDVIKNDPDDNKFLEAALEAKADYLVSRDKKHILVLKKFENTLIIPPEQFLEIIERETK